MLSLSPRQDVPGNFTGHLLEDCDLPSPHTLLSKNTPDISMSTVYLDQTIVSIDNIQNIQKILTIVSSSIFEPDFVPPSNSVQFLRNCSSPKLYTRDYWTENPG